MAGVIQDEEPASWPALVQRPGGVERSGDVPSAVDKNSWDVTEEWHAGEDDLPVDEEAAVAPVVP